MGIIKSAIVDAILTSIFVFSISTLRILSTKTSHFLNLEPLSLQGLFITTLINTIIILIISLISKILGGASFNPSSTISFYTLGLRPNSSLLSMSITFPSQAIGATIGIKSILQIMPKNYHHMIKGPSLKVGLHKGALVEGLLSFTHNFFILIVMLNGPKNPWIKVYLLSLVTLGLVIVGSDFTGPSLNPANAFGWAYLNNKHNCWEQFYVFWICPLFGASLAALVYRFLFMSPIKEKKA